jgi:hypothetical protein
VGWFTTGPGGLREKSGDVRAVARSSRLGTLCLIPRVNAENAEGEVIETDDLEFLGTLQDTIERSGLPWRHLDFTGESLRVDYDVDVRLTLRELGDLVAEQADSVLSVLAEVDADAVISRLTVSVDVEWTLAEPDFPALVEWLNAPFGGSEPLSLTGLAEGNVDEHDFGRLAVDDHARHLAALALVGAVRTGGPVWLNQPDDDLTFLAWNRHLDGGSGGAVLLRPVDHPFLELLAEAFGVRAEVREQVFYVYGGAEVELPPEAKASRKDIRTGMAFATYLSRLVAEWAEDRLVPRDGEESLFFGWHVGGGLAALTEAFTTAGVPVHSLDRLLDGERQPFTHLSETARLAVLRDGNADNAVYGFLAGDGPPPAKAGVETVACLLVVVEKLDLPAAERDRLTEVLRIAARRR